MFFFLSKAKIIYKFSKLNYSTRSKVDIQSLFRLLELEKKDELAIKFWQTGLSNQCKMQIRAT